MTGEISMKFKFVLFLATLALTMCFIDRNLPSHAQVISDQPIEQVDQFLEHLVPYGFSGSVLVEQNNKLLLQQAYGFADESTQRPMTNDTAFDIASVTKHFTAAALLLLQERGLLGVQDTIGQYLDVPEDKRDITIQQLLMHQSGFSSLTNINIGPGQPEPNLDDFLSQPLDYVPGTDYAYSNLGYGVLGKLISVVSGQSYQDFVRANLFAPAGMSQSGFRTDDWEDQAVAHGYINFEDIGSPATWPPFSDWLIGAGGIVATPGDLYRWSLALRNGSVLDSVTVSELFAPRRQVDPDLSEVYGGFVRDIPEIGRRYSMFGGGIPGHTVGFIMELDAQSTIVVASGRYLDSRAFSLLALPIIDMLSGQTLDPAPAVANLSTDRQAGLLGQYLTPDGQTILISQGDLGRLWIELDSQHLINTLYGFSPELQENLLDASATIKTVVDAFVRQDYMPIETLSLGNFTADWVADFLLRNNEDWQFWVDTYGEFLGYDILATIPESSEFVTYVRFNFDDGVRFMRFTTIGADELFGFETLDDLQLRRLVQPTSESTLVSFNMESLTASELSFSTNEAGITTQIEFPDGTIAVRAS
jgi:CubicO group peptidase (beta-lactamase class C family)